MDSGFAWTACANTNLGNLNVLLLVSNPAGRLYAGTEDGVYVSNDDGPSWMALDEGMP